MFECSGGEAGSGFLGAEKKRKKKKRKKKKEKSRFHRMVLAATSSVPRGTFFFFG